MTRTIPVNTIVDLVRGWSDWAPDAEIRAVLNGVISNIQRNAADVAVADESSRSVRDVVESFHEFLEPDAFEKLLETDICVINQPICNAGASLDRRSIIIFDGLLEVLKYRIEHSLMVARVNQKIREKGDLFGIRPADFKRVAFESQMLSLHYLHNPESLPGLDKYFDANLRRDAWIAFGGSLIFTLLHELGHLELRHGENYGSRTQKFALPTLAVLEEMNHLKQDEFEADSFAFSAIAPRARSMFIVNALFLMGLILDYEVMAGSLSRTHPLALNRVFRMNDLSGASEDPSISTHAKKILDTRLSLFQSRLESVHPDEGLLPEAVRREINLDAFKKVMGDKGSSLAALDVLINAFHLASLD